MDTIELKDFLDFTYLSDVALSPDGSRAAYLRHRCDTEKDGYATQLWVIGPDGHGAAVGAEGKKPLSIAVEELYSGKIKILGEDEEIGGDMLELSEDISDEEVEISEEESEETAGEAESETEA